MKIKKEKYSDLVSQIGNLLHLGRAKAAREVNTILVQTYWEIGRYIVEFEQDGNEKAEYGSNLLNRLAKELMLTYGKGFGRSNLFLHAETLPQFSN